LRNKKFLKFIIVYTYSCKVCLRVYVAVGFAFVRAFSSYSSLFSPCSLLLSGVQQSKDDLFAINYCV